MRPTILTIASIYHIGQEHDSHEHYVACEKDAAAIEEANCHGSDIESVA